MARKLLQKAAPGDIRTPDRLVRSQMGGRRGRSTQAISAFRHAMTGLAARISR